MPYLLCYHSGPDYSVFSASHTKLQSTSQVLHPFLPFYSRDNGMSGCPMIPGQEKLELRASHSEPRGETRCCLGSGCVWGHHSGAARAGQKEKDSRVWGSSLCCDSEWTARVSQWLTCGLIKDTCRHRKEGDSAQWDPGFSSTTLM